MLTQDRRKVQIKICEGKYHQVRRMLAAVGCPVQALTRTHMGALTLDPALRPGECRLLTEAEKEKITQITRWTAAAIAAAVLHRLSFFRIVWDKAGGSVPDF